MSDFLPLYGKSSTGKTKVWSIAVNHAMNGNGIISTTHGYLDSKMITTEKEITAGKNLGRKNATTSFEQAIAEAKSAWTKKRESGYFTQIDSSKDNMDAKTKDSMDTKSKGIDEDVPNVMLAHDYNKRGKDIQFPCYSQPKLDGTRAIAIPHKGIFSRNRKAYPHLEHIIDEINQLPASIILDGELYSSELSFQEIVGLVKRETLLPQDIQKQHSIKLHVYDLIMPDTSFHDRYSQLIALFHSYRFQYIVLVQTDTCDNKTTIQSYYTKYMHDGYEGIMLRNKNGLYRGVRSTDLQKYKEFIDDEFEIVGFEEGAGLEAGCIIWICKTADGKTFHCRPRGTRHDRQSLFINGTQYIGKHLTVRYQELSDTNIPRFPVGIAVRDYE